MIPRKKTSNLHIAYCFIVLHLHIVFSKIFFDYESFFFVIHGLNGTSKKLFDVIKNLTYTQVVSSNAGK